MQVVTTPEFEALVKKLSKTYRLVDQDIENLIEELEQGLDQKTKDFRTWASRKSTRRD